MITKEITIEDLVTILPDSVTYLMEKGIRALICGEPVWGTLEELVLAKGYSNEQLENFVSDLNKMLAEKTKTMAQ
ncbi:MAG: DUF1858 domain-containing protein [Candidatus Kapaibacteriota bacterium]